MPYVQRDKTGKVIALYGAKQDFTDEVLPPEDNEVVEFLKENSPENTPIDIKWPI